jgi:hypothetical protein
MLGSIQSRKTSIKISAFLFGTRIRNDSSGIALNTTVHPLPLHFVFPFLPAPIYFVVVDLNGLISSVDFLRVASAYRTTDNSFVRPERKQAAASENFAFHISY